MAIQNKLSLETRFQLDNTPQNFKITDNSDYASEGIATSDVEGILSIKDPSGVVIHTGNFGSPDIDLDVQDYIDTIALPKDSNNEIIKGSYEITYTSRVGGAVQPGDYTEAFTYNYCYTPIEVDILMTVDLICSKLISLDETQYPTEVTSNTRTHTISPPAAVDSTEYPEKTAATASLIYSPITTKTWTSQIESILVLTYSDGLIVDVTITGAKEKEIKSGINICNLKCNITALVQRYEAALGTNTVNAVRIYNDELAPSITSMMMFNASVSCGNFEEAESYYNKVLQYTGSQPDCMCSDSDEPTLIEAVCSTGEGHVIQDEGTDLPTQAKLNFVGDGVEATDNPATGATDVTINLPASSGHAIADEGSVLPSQPTLNFIGADVTVTDNAGSNSTDVTIAPAAAGASYEVIYYNEFSGIYFVIPDNTAWYEITGTKSTIPAGKGGTYEFNFITTLLAYSSPVIGAGFSLFVNGAQYNGTSQKIESIDYRIDGAPNSNFNAIAYSLSEIVLSAGDVVELRVVGHLSSPNNSNRLNNGSFKLAKYL